MQTMRGQNMVTNVMLSTHLIYGNSEQKALVFYFYLPLSMEQKKNMLTSSRYKGTLDTKCVLVVNCHNGL